MGRLCIVVSLHKNKKTVSQGAGQVTNVKLYMRKHCGNDYSSSKWQGERNTVLSAARSFVVCQPVFTVAEFVFQTVFQNRFQHNIAGF